MRPRGNDKCESGGPPDGGWGCWYGRSLNPWCWRRTPTEGCRRKSGKAKFESEEGGEMTIVLGNLEVTGDVDKGGGGGEPDCSGSKRESVERN